MVVQHNLTAMNSNRMLGLTTKSQAKSTERLSSGYKINRAADDAAGLSISEKMRKQVRGLTQASANAQDGISAVQTAEGALTEVHDMLQRMNELAVKAANGTNSETDRSYVQAEIDQLVIEIDRVSTTTKFNETYLLKGTNSDGEIAKLSYDTAEGNLGTKIGGAALTFDEDGVATVSLAAGNSAETLTLNTQESYLTEAVNQTEALTATTSQNTVISTGLSASSDTQIVSTEVTTQTGVTTLGTAASTTDTTTISVTEALAEGKKLTIDGVEYALYEGASDEAMEKKGYTDDATKKYFTDKASFTSALKEAAGEVGTGDIKEVTIDSDGTVNVSAFADLNDGLDVSLHVGADSSTDNKINLNINMMSARGLGINGIKVDGDTFDSATAAVDVISEAIQRVSTQRSALGAVQNRLEHTVNNLDNVAENTTSAESAIRDTDMATEMVKYSNNNILAQAGQAMLAQANQSNQGVLSLLG